jgi:hypothetical protein
MVRNELLNSSSARKQYRQVDLIVLWSDIIDSYWENPLALGGESSSSCRQAAIGSHVVV